MQNKLHFQKSGQGTKRLLLFHGFGQTHAAFDGLLPVVSNEYTIYALDLYYHGESIRPDNTLSLSEWKKNIGLFLKQENITRFSIVAFSLGGRFALATASSFPEQMEKLILIAPDGIYKNFWFVFATSKLGNPVFYHMMHHPERFDRLLKFFEKWHLTSVSMIRFARKELSDRENCLRVYRSWTYFKRLQLSPAQITRILNDHQIEVHLVLGGKDNIIPIREILPKLSRIRKLNKHILPLKHHHLIDGAKELLRSIL